MVAGGVLCSDFCVVWVLEELQANRLNATTKVKYTGVVILWTPSSPSRPSYEPDLRLDAVILLNLVYLQSVLSLYYNRKADFHGFSQKTPCRDLGEHIS